MFFDQAFINSVEDSPIEGIVKACDLALAKQKEIENQQEWTEAEHELLWDASTFVKLVLEDNEISLEIEYPAVTPEIATNIPALIGYLEAIKNALNGLATEVRITSYQNRYSTIIKSRFAYEFSQGDFNRIQVLVNEIREQILGNELLEEDHKQRLLKRLESLQSELHKRVSDLDRFWGLIGDAGVVLGKLGKDSKPIVDRIKEVAEIIWNTQARTEELPSGTQNPMIEHDEEQP